LPCIPVEVAAGRYLPGVPRNALYGELSWHDTGSGVTLAIEGKAESRTFVNDLNTDAAPFYVEANLRAEITRHVGDWTLGGFARLENLLDRKYAGSVIVNDGNSRFFEPAPGRSAYAGLNARYNW
jgi:iron complex outermembrane receptor protein